MDYTYGISDDYLDDDDDGVMYSTKNYSSDSEDERPFGFVQSHKRQHKKLKCQESDEDDFEKEMAAELEATVKKLTASFSSSSSRNAGMENSKEPEYYDEVYFDSDQSDSEEEGASPNQSRRKEKHKVISNDDLLYDPTMDDADQAWVDSKRRAYQVKTKGVKRGKGPYKPEPLPQSDAVLSCPACFTTLCLDCQRHEVYKNQYRAMFVFNCVTDKSEILRFAVKEEKKKKFKKTKKRSRQPDASAPVPMEAAASESMGGSKQPQFPVAPLPIEAAALESVSGSDCARAISHEVSPAVSAVVKADEMGENDEFHPVMCSICTTKVGVQDQSELYHFFNVLTSY